jgi:Mn-dependent DtxR family transcriptional regulator
MASRTVFLKLWTLSRTQISAVITEIVRELKLSMPIVTSSFQKLEELALVREITGKQRGRLQIIYCFV